MNAGRLLAHYERIADAPDAIPRLRRFILDLAVRGKLVEQDPKDEPAATLLAGWKRYKLQEFHASGTLGWLVAPVGALLDFRYGKGMKASERLKEGPVPVFGSNGIVGYCETPLTEVPSIIVGRKGSAGALNLCNGPSWTTDVAYFVEAPSFFDLRYLLIGLQVLDLGSLGKGVKPGLSRSDAYDLPLSVPPVAEQHRIVAKVDELMALCDRLETEHTARETTRDRLTAATLARLNEPDPDPAVFRNHAAFALDNLIPLTTCPGQIKALRQTILNLAVRGKLVEQDPNDEPASELLKRIAAEKARMVKAGEIRKQKILLPIHHDDMPVEDIPGWVWVRLGEVSTMITKGSTPTSYGHAYTKQGVNFVKVESIKNGSLLSEKITSFISNETHGFLARSQLAAGDILFSIAGSIGTCAVVTKQVLPANTNQALAIIRGTQAAFLSEFLLKSLQSSVAQSVVQKARGGAMNNISLNDIRNFVVPLPPIAEQHRIVAKVDELMSLCDQLEASLVAGEDTRSRLLNAMLQETLH